jgi:hypothetical protein
MAGNDKTSSKRQRSYLDDLANSGGKTVRLDLAKEDIIKLDELVAYKQADSRAEYLRSLIRVAHQRMVKAEKKKLEMV